MGNVSGAQHEANVLELHMTSDGGPIALKAPPSFNRFVDGNITSLAVSVNGMIVVRVALEWHPDRLDVRLLVADEQAPPGVGWPAGYSHELRSSTLRIPR